MQPIEFRGRVNPTSTNARVLWVVALLGLIVGLSLVHPAFALGWAIGWGVLAYLTSAVGKAAMQQFTIRLDDAGIEIKTRKRFYSMKWGAINIIAWESNGSHTGDDLIFRSSDVRYVYERCLNDVDFSDLIEALKDKNPCKSS